MALTIKNIPVLESATAEEFVRSAEEDSVKAMSRLSDSAKKRLQKMLKKSRSFRFNRQWARFPHMTIASCSPITTKPGKLHSYGKGLYVLKFYVNNVCVKTTKYLKL